MNGGMTRGPLFVVLGAVSLAAGAVLIAIGSITRQRHMVAAGRRRFSGTALERRWISDLQERERHAAVVAERLDLEASPVGPIPVAEAAERLGVSASTVRRRAKRGQLQGVYRAGRLTGVILEAD
jgi:excisionase family DNA binding protein